MALEDPAGMFSHFCVTWLTLLHRGVLFVCCVWWWSLFVTSKSRRVSMNPSGHEVMHGKGSYLEQWNMSECHSLQLRQQRHRDKSVEPKTSEHFLSLRDTDTVRVLVTGQSLKIHLLWAKNVELSAWLDCCWYSQVGLIHITKIRLFDYGLWLICPILCI